MTCWGLGDYLGDLLGQMMKFNPEKFSIVFVRASCRSFAPKIQICHQVKSKADYNIGYNLGVFSNVTL